MPLPVGRHFRIAHAIQLFLMIHVFEAILAFVNSRSNLFTRTS